MFNLRRYRLFLLVATVVAVTVYYLAIPLRPSLSSRVGRPLTPQYEAAKPNKPPSVVPQHPPTAQRETEEVLAPKPLAIPHTVQPVTADDEVEVTELPLTPISTSTSQSSQETSTIKNADPAAEIDRTKSTKGEKLPQHVSSDNVQSVHKESKQRYPISDEDVIALPSGRPQVRPQIQFAFTAETSLEKEERLKKRTVIRKSFQHAWQGYKTHAMGHDELKPLTGDFADPPQFMGWGATLIDTLDTLWIMGMYEDFASAVELVSTVDFTTSSSLKIPMFETVIRYLGGLLAAYDLSAPEYPVLLTKAVELADVLLGAFDTPNHMPVPTYQWSLHDITKPHRSNKNTVLAELGTMSMEFTRLAQLTNNYTYYDAIARVTNALELFQANTALPGLWPLRVDSSGCKASEIRTTKNSKDSGPLGGSVKGPSADAEQPLDDEEPAVYTTSRSKGTSSKTNSEAETVESDDMSVSKRDSLPQVQEENCKAQGLTYEPNAKITFGIGGQADSVYEYLPKMHSLLGGLTTQYKTMYEMALKAIRTNLLFKPMIPGVKRDILFAAKHELSLEPKSQAQKNKVIWEGTHLSCFAGGMLGLASKLFDTPSDIETARRLTDGCIWAYESMASGIMPEEFAVVPCDPSQTCQWSEEKWHEALDPDFQERLDMVDAYNQNQRKIYGSQTPLSHDTFEKGAMKTGVSKPEATPYKGGLAHDVDHQHHKRSDTKIDEKPTRALLHVFEDTDSISDGLEFKPKVALSHEKYVQARIQEERLPPGYTKIPDRTYRLRPEAIESVFIMWRLTGEQYWREKGWMMFESIQAATQTKFGHAALYDVTSVLLEQRNNMESFWLAETLKYFYLLFSEPDLISLDEYVLNTEAHPFKLPQVPGRGDRQLV